MISTNPFQGIASRIQFEETRDYLLTEWNFYRKEKRQAIYDRHYRLMVGMMDKYNLHTCWCLRAHKNETTKNRCDCGEML